MGIRSTPQEVSPNQVQSGFLLQDLVRSVIRCTIQVIQWCTIQWCTIQVTIQVIQSFGAPNPSLYSKWTCCPPYTM
eukprot:1157301-Pelagomonas_calceolata.AAC.1